MARKNSYTVAIDGSEDFVAPRRRGKRHNWWKYLLVFLAGQLSFTVIGVAAAAVVLTGPEIGIVDQEHKYVTEDAGKLSLAGLLAAIMGNNPQDVKTLDDMKDYVQVDSIVQQIQDALDENLAEFGISIDCSDLKNVEFEKMGDWVTGQLYNIPIEPLVDKFGLGDFLGAIPGIVNKKVQKTDQYGNLMFDGQLTDISGNLIYDITTDPETQQEVHTPKYDVDPDTQEPIKGNPVYEKVQKTDQYGNPMFDGQLKDPDTGELLYDVTTDPETQQEVYTPKYDTDTVSGEPIKGEAIMVDKTVSKTIGDFLNGGFNFEDIMSGLTLGTLAPIFGLDVSSGIFAAIKDEPLSNLTTALMDKPLWQLLGKDENDDSLLGGKGALGKLTINGLSSGNPLDGLQICDVMPDSKTDTGILGTMAYAFVSDSFPTNAPSGATAPTEAPLEYWLDTTDPSNPVKMYYDESRTDASNPDNHWFKYQTLNDVIGDITIGDAIGGTKPTEGILASLWDCKPSEVESEINNIALGTVLGGTAPTDGILAKLWNAKIGNITDEINHLKLNDVMAGGTGVLATLGPCFITDWANGKTFPTTQPTDPEKYDLWEDAGVKKYYDGTNWVKYETMTDKVNNLTIGDAIGDETQKTGILAKLWDKKPSELSSAINSLKLGDVITGGLKIGEKDLSDVAIEDLGEEVDKITVAEFFGTAIYKNGSKAQGYTGVWKYLLTDPNDPSKDLSTTAITQMTSLFNNLGGNITTATLNDLVADGLISAGSADLTKPMPTVENPTRTLGDMTITGILEFISSI